MISRMSDIVMIRTFEQEIIERFAANSRVPIINGLTNEYHPARSWPTSTYIEHRGRSRGKTVAWVGIRTTSATPGCRPPRCSISRSACRRPGLRVEADRAGLRHRPLRAIPDPMDACRGADLVTTDVWTSMGFGRKNEKRLKAFADWCVDGDMMRVANRDAVFMHCLPPTGARR